MTKLKIKGGKIQMPKGRKKDKTKQQLEKEFQKKVDIAIKDVKKLEKKHTLMVLKRACYTYFRGLLEKERALNEIKRRERELNNLKKKYKI